MELLKLQQGSAEWLAERLNRLTASEAPIMMGVSKHMTRNQLLDHKKGWVTFIDEFTMKLFDKGHKSEGDARNVLAVEEMDDYLPCVGVSSYFVSSEPDSECLHLLASFDGRSDNEDHLFEHKLWNEILASNVRNGVLEPSHYWQLEHQLLVDEKAKYVLFVVSDGTEEKREMMKYYSLPDRRQELISAWELFQSDLENHHIEAKQELIIAEQNNFPILSCKVIGSEITTNISICLNEIKELAKSELNRPFETDQDFADKDQLNKDVKKLRAALKQNVESIKGAFVSYSDFEAVALEMDGVLQQMQSSGEKQVKKAKENKKYVLKNNISLAIFDHIGGCDFDIGAPFSINQIVDISPVNMQLDLAMKNKSSIVLIENALDSVLNEWKLKLNEATKLIAPNFKFLEANADEYKFLFPDVFVLINQSEESFKAIVNTRINAHKSVEAEKLAVETARIKKEATEKAEAAAAKKLADDSEFIRQQERDKVNAENKLIHEHSHSEAILIKDEFDEFKANERAGRKEPPTPIHPQKVSASKQAVNSATQLQRNISAIESQATHNPLPTDFIVWSQNHKIDSMAFLELEKLINKHFR